MALAGTKTTTRTSLTEPGAGVLPGGKPSSKLGSFGRNFWQTVKPFGWQGLLLVAVLILLYASVLKLLVYQWYIDPDYSHGFLVPVLSAFLIWQRRDTLRLIPRQPSPWGMVIVAGSLGLLFLGSLGAELSMARLSMLGTICGLIVYFAGSKFLRAMAFHWRFCCLPFPYR